jgi:serine/threonine protein kinase
MLTFLWPLRSPGALLQKADVWSCGVLLYTMCCNAYPFRRPEDDRLPHAEALNAQFSRILRGDYQIPPERQLRCARQPELGADGARRALPAPWRQTQRWHICSSGS